MSWDRTVANKDQKPKAGGQVDPGAFAAQYEEHLAAQSRGKQFMQKKTFAPSTIGYRHGNCPRYWTIAFTGAEFNNQSDAMAIANMSNGTYSHERIQDVFDDMGILESDELEIVHEDPPIRGFIDAIIKWGELSPFPLEIKTAKQEIFDAIKASGKPIDYHAMQLLMYMKVLNSDEGLLFYENRNTNAILVMPIYMNERISVYGDYLFDWMRQVKTAYDSGKMAAVPWKNGLKNKNCLYCPLKEACPTFGGDDDVHVPPLKVMVV